MLFCLMKVSTQFLSFQMPHPLCLSQGDVFESGAMGKGIRFFFCFCFFVFVRNRTTAVYELFIVVLCA